MNGFYYLFILSRITALIIIPAILSGITIIKIIIIRKKNGAVIFKERKINYYFLFAFIINSLLFAFLINTEHIILSILIYLITIFILFGAYLENFIESLECGIYKEGIVYPRYTTTWSGIEGIIDLKPVIRFIHKEKGAFDISIGEINYYNNLEIIKQHVQMIEKRKAL